MEDRCIAIVRKYNFKKDKDGAFGDYFSEACALLTMILEAGFVDSMGLVEFGKARNTSQCSVEINGEKCICRLTLSECESSFTIQTLLRIEQSWWCGWGSSYPKLAHRRTKEMFGDVFEGELRRLFDDVTFNWISQDEWLAEREKNKTQ